MGDIKRQRPAPDFQRHRQPFSGGELAAIGDPDRQAGDQHEGFGGIGKAEVLVRQIFEVLSRNVVDEDRQQAQRPEHVEACVTLVGNHSGGRRVDTTLKSLLQHAVRFPGFGAPAPSLLKRAPTARAVIQTREMPGTMN
ncbi:hypothetical protein D9M72_478120 [compost metagenome]